MKLKEVAQVFAGQAAPKDADFGNEGIPFIRAGHLEDLCSGNIKESDLPKISMDFAKKNRLKLLPKNSILFAKSGMSATLNRVYLTQNDSYYVSHLAAVIPNKQIDPLFLVNWFVNFKPSRLINDPSYPSIRASDIEEIEIKFPQMSTQKEISEIFAKSKLLVEKRRQSIAKLDQLAQSIFLDMFGDPVSNPKKWPVKKFGEVCETRLGKMLDEKKQTHLVKKPYLRNANVLWNKFNLSDVYEMGFEKDELDEFRLVDGDLLICEGGDIGRTALWKSQLQECYFQKALHRARVYKDLALPEFIMYLMYMLSIGGYFKQFSAQATIAHLTGVKLKSMPIPLPPLKLQQEFVDRMSKIESLKNKLLISASSLENLQQSLSQKFFEN